MLGVKRSADECRGDGIIGLGPDRALLARLPPPPPPLTGRGMMPSANGVWMAHDLEAARLLVPMPLDGPPLLLEPVDEKAKALPATESLSVAIQTHQTTSLG